MYTIFASDLHEHSFIKYFLNCYIDFICTTIKINNTTGQLCSQKSPANMFGSQHTCICKVNNVCTHEYTGGGGGGGTYTSPLMALHFLTFPTFKNDLLDNSTKSQIHILIVHWYPHKDAFIHENLMTDDVQIRIRNIYFSFITYIAPYIFTR